jgi:hypothetical protein
VSKLELAENTITIGGLTCIATLFLGFEGLFMALAVAIIVLIIAVVVIENRGSQ